ncbi:MAG: DUF5615 family PIN-like protein [Pyrinomonadaceae bacterium]
MRFYADENFPLAVVVELRRFGHDVLTVFEDGRANKALPDEKVLARSIKLNRAILTINRIDFRRLHNSGIEHCGIVICTFDIDFVRQAKRIDLACAEKSEFNSELVRVNRPAKSFE